MWTYRSLSREQTTGCLCGWSMARSRESSPLSFPSSPRRFQRILVCKLPREMNRLFACSTQSKMAINILDHVRTLAVLLVAMLSNGGSRRAATAPARAIGGASPPFLPTFCNDLRIQMRETKLLACSSDKSKLQYSKAPPESLYDLSKFFWSSKLKQNWTTSVSPSAPSSAKQKNGSKIMLDAAAGFLIIIGNLPLRADYAIIDYNR